MAKQWQIGMQASNIYPIKSLELMPIINPFYGRTIKEGEKPQKWKKKKKQQTKQNIFFLLCSDFDLDFVSTRKLSFHFTWVDFILARMLFLNAEYILFK